MQEDKWKEVENCYCKNHYKIKPVTTSGSSIHSITFNFTHVAFDPSDEILVAVDVKGFLYLIELRYEGAAYKKIDFVGPCTFIEFNPINKNYILVGLQTKSIKIARFGNFDDFCLLSGHTSLPRNPSFYKDYCLTVSNHEIIIWNLHSYSKSHQLNTKNTNIRKAAFSNLGLIAVLYKNDIIQAWEFQKFEKDVKINLRNFDLQHIKDFTFTKDGKCMIIGGLQCHIVVFNTQNWHLLTNNIINKNLPGINEMITVPRPLDGGANKIIAVLLSNCTVKFIDLITLTFIKDCCCQSMNMVRSISISHNGLYMAQISKNGDLVITLLENILSNNFVKKINKESNVLAHRAEEHLQYIQQTVKDELKLDRLLPILKEFGEYPAKHRALIWSTILKLPSNKEAYVSLCNKDSSPFVVNILKNYPLTDKTRITLLTTTIDCLIHLCSLFESCTFLPGLIFPFITVFQKNPLLIFEAVLTVILNYCQKWWEYHPLPPLNILGIIENILLESDPTLLTTFCERGITSTNYAWPLLRTTFSEVLPANEWLILWDNLLSYGRPSLFLMSVVAYNICSRQIIMSTLKSPEDLERFYNSQGNIGAKKILKVAGQLDRKISQQIHPSKYIRNKIEPIVVSDIYPPFPQQEYPKILIDDLRVQNLKKLKKQEHILQSQRQRAAKLAEEQRIRTESENFKKEIQKIRMNELKKCYEEQIYQQMTIQNNVIEDDVWDSFDEHKSLYRKYKKFSSEESEQESEKNTHLKYQRKINNTDKYKEMQKQVAQLEFEVCNLLAHLQSVDHKVNK